VKAAVLILAVGSPTTVLIMETLYDLGVRRATNMVLWGIEFWKTDYPSSDPTELGYKREELMMGGMELGPSTWISDFGQELSEKYSDYTEISSPHWSACFYYDSAISIARTFDWMLAAGTDYEDPAAFRVVFKSL
jgi:hypothetical protein